MVPTTMSMKHGDTARVGASWMRRARCNPAPTEVLRLGGLDVVTDSPCPRWGADCGGQEQLRGADPIRRRTVRETRRGLEGREH